MADINDNAVAQSKEIGTHHEALQQYVPNSRPETPPAPSAPESPNPVQDSATQALPKIDTNGWKDATATGATDAPAGPGAPTENPYLTPAAIEGADGDHHKSVKDAGKDSSGTNDSTDGGRPDGPIFGQKDILDAAKGGVGQELWRGGRYESSVNGGVLGSAASVSRILQNAGYGIDSPAIRGVEQQLKSSDAFDNVPVTERQAGDIMITTRPDGSQRIGIVGEGGKMFGMRQNGVWGHYDMPKDTSKATVYRAKPTCPE
jgi:hypothetical protein